MAGSKKLVLDIFTVFTVFEHTLFDLPSILQCQFFESKTFCFHSEKRNFCSLFECLFNPCKSKLKGLKKEGKSQPGKKGTKCQNVKETCDNFLMKSSYNIYVKDISK